MLEQRMDDLGPRQPEAVRILEPQVLFRASLTPHPFGQVSEDFIGMCLIGFYRFRTHSELF